MKYTLLCLVLGAQLLVSAETPTFLGAGTGRSTLGKISKYSPVNGGLWTGFWKPKKVTTSVKEYSWESQINAWPNPTNGNLNVSYTGNIKIFSSLGVEVFSGVIDQNIDISRLASGSYLILTETNKSIKIIKQ